MEEPIWINVFIRYGWLNGASGTVKTNIDMRIRERSIISTEIGILGERLGEFIRT